MTRAWIASGVLLLGLASVSVSAAEGSGGAGEEVEIDKIKDKYWAGDEKTEVGVVQNRLYSKARKFELGVDYSVLNSDPFLSASTLGGALGYNVSEYLG